MKDADLTESIDHLCCRLHELVVQKQHEFDWFKSHFQFATKHDLEQFEHRVTQQLKTIMANQVELTKQVTDLTAKVGKISAESRGLLTKIEELLAVIAAGGNVSPELQAAVDALQAQVDVLDALVPDAPTPPPV